jgi:N-glycosylase/DNA lyase
MSKQLSMQVIKEDVKKYDEFIELPVKAQGNEYIVKIYPFFKPEKVRDMLNEMIGFYRNCEKEKVNVKDEEFDDIVGYFIVKHFTNIKTTTSEKAKKIYEEFKVAINSQLFEVILKTLPEESIQYVYNKIFEIIELNAKLQNKIKKFQDEIKNLPLENKDILFSNQDDENNVIQ